MIDRAVVDNPRIPWARYAPLWPYLRWGLFALGLLFIVGVFAGVIPYRFMVQEDARNYWEGLAYTDPHYRYSPAFLWLTAPLRLLPFEAFAVVWAALHVAAVIWLGPWLMAFPFVADDIIAGNINTFLAVGVVLAVKGHAWSWAFPLLTKVTPGVGVLYHVGRREWGAVFMAGAVTLSIVAIGGAIDPMLWMGWVDSLRAGTENYATIDVLAPLPVRIAIGAALCLAASKWVWLLPVGMIVAMPGLWPSSFALLAAIPLLLKAERVPVPVGEQGVVTDEQPRQLATDDRMRAG
jgi:hypothetical protein